jgi:single-strand DNA-binding protein
MPDFKMPTKNSWTGVGYVSRDPELKYTRDNKAILSFTVGVPGYSGGKETTEWIKVTVWDSLAERLARELWKGCPVDVEGRLKTDEWTNPKTGATQNKTQVWAYKVQVLVWPPKTEQQPPAPTTEPLPEDDIPF